MSLKGFGKYKIFISILIIFLISLLFTLIFLDTPEYVHCSHISICEFLDIQGVLPFSKESKDINHIFFKGNEFSEYSHFVLTFKDSFYIDNVIPDFGLIDTNHILIRIINLSHKILFSSLILNRNILPNIKWQTFFPAKINLLSKIIEITTSSVIRS